MNRLVGTITALQTNDTLSLVNMAVDEFVFTTIVIDTPETVPYLEIGKKVALFFKETEVILATRDILELSIQNKIPGKISALKEGKLLSEVTIDIGKHKLKSVITTAATQQLKLKVNDVVWALIKTNEISIASND
ncbi:TOBE domain-containing protein [Arenibacter sp. GZD96]|uniref:TOBE domain-containing protein n=1 Tax=Aurantibrevibacter litoralis TaxID=3106030 RepID=UPI002AFF490F|nr:TOBE domain-containing protein [Arenibacter sp. GZD-96]MEA1786195.1 TOBE domain-containing protein [Arenibacter sp. GZD-96]